MSHGVNKDPRDVLRRPVVSEKSYGLLDEQKYTFEVDPNANKTEIKLAVEKVFKVKVADVNTLNRKGKRPDTKRAIVTLKGDDRIDIFGGQS